MFGSGVRALFGSSTAAARRLSEADETLRAALPISRRVSFLSVAGGSGTTSALASASSVLSRRRPGMVLAVDAAGGRSGLRHQFAPHPGARVGSFDEPGTGSDVDPDVAATIRRGARTAAEARHGLDHSASGVHLLTPETPGGRPANPEEWRLAVGPIARFFDLVLTDWGVRADPADAVRIAAETHLTVVVARSEPDAAARAAGLAHAITAGASDLDTARTMVLLVDVAGHGARTAAGWRRRGLSVLVLPREPTRLRTTVPSSRSFGPATRDAHLALAAMLTSASLSAANPATHPATDPARQPARAAE